MPLPDPNRPRCVTIACAGEDLELCPGSEHVILGTQVNHAVSPPPAADGYVRALGTAGCSSCRARGPVERVPLNSSTAGLSWSTTTVMACILQITATGVASIS
jgi:hypothetical protein